LNCFWFFVPIVIFLLVLTTLLVVAVKLYDFVSYLPSKSSRSVKKQYFGIKEQSSETNKEIRQFRATYDEEEWEKLKERIRLDLENLVDPLDPPVQGYGDNIQFLRTLADYWTNKYNWKASVTNLNYWPQFMTSISGMDLHFIHVKPTNAGPVSIRPILLLHSFSTSVNELHDLIPLLVAKKGNNVVFEVVAPSLPGHGWGQPPRKPGFDYSQAAIMMGELMHRLGHNKFYIHAGGTGALVADEIATLFPKRVLGLHTTMPMLTTLSLLLSYLPTLIPIYRHWVIDKEDRQPTQTVTDKLREMYTYYMVTKFWEEKSDVLVVSLVCSPLGLAAWFLDIVNERMAPPSIEPGLVRLPVGVRGLDWFITNLMIIIMSRSAIPLSRFIKDNKNFQLRKVNVPTGIAVYPFNPFPVMGGIPRALVEKRYENIVRFSRMGSGGYFSAIEQPRRLHTDILAFVRNLENTHQPDTSSHKPTNNKN